MICYITFEYLHFLRGRATKASDQDMNEDKENQITDSNAANKRTGRKRRSSSVKSIEESDVAPIPVARRTRRRR